MAPIEGKGAAGAQASDPSNRSRYGASKPSEFDAVDEVRAEDVPGLVGALRDAFDREETRSLAWRRQHLLAFRRMMVEGEAELCAALQLDLHKSPFEGFLTELNLVVSEIDVFLHELAHWMQPEKVKTSALNAPSWCTLQRDPLGVCLLMGAWNYPAQLQLAPLVGCIAGGNCAVLKPGSYAAHTSNCIARLLPKYMDKRYFIVIEGNREVSSALLNQKFDLIFFTGSAFVGKVVARAAAEHLTPVVLELGGKSPCIVDKTADIEHSAKRIVWAKFLNSGQTCVANDFLCVHESVAAALLKEIQKQVLQFYGQNAQSTEWYGRIINTTAFARLTKLIAGEKDRIVVGGQSDAADRFIAPTVVDFGTDWDAFRKSDLMADELFGPVLPVYRYKDLEQIIQFVKHLPTGKPLALYAYGSDPSFVQAIKQRTTSGGLIINDSIMHLANHEMPFGGVGNSGMGGGYHGKHSFERFTHLKPVMEKSQLIDQSILCKPVLDCRFPPYTPFKKLVVSFAAKAWVDRLINLPLPLMRAAIKALLLYVAFTLAGFRVTRD